MFRRGVLSARGLRAVSVVGVTAALLAVPALGAGAKAKSHEIQGTFTTTSFSGSGCTSPIHLCADGPFRGFLNGQANAVATSLAPTSQPGIFIGTADVVIHDRRGDVLCTETFIFNGTPGSDGEEGVVCEVTGGTGQFAGATGYVNGYGTTPPGQPSTGHYAGTLTLP